MGNSTITASVADLDRELNQLLQQGRVFEAFDRFYSEQVSMQENLDPPCVGKAANLERERGFFGSLERYEFRLLAEAASGDVSFGEWELDLTFKGGQRVRRQQVSVRRWRDGQIVPERFYHQG